LARVAPDVDANGTVNFWTLVKSVNLNGVVTDIDGLTVLKGPAFLARLDVGKNPDSLSPVGVAVPFQEEGCIDRGKVFRPLAQGAVASILLRAGEAAGGTTYEVVCDSGCTTGFSNVIQAMRGGDDINERFVSAILAGMQGLADDHSRALAGASRDSGRVGFALALAAEGTGGGRVR
jgi:hypothetical protein